MLRRCVCRMIALPKFRAPKAPKPWHFGRVRSKVFSGFAPSESVA